jgi:hypothetical protein
MHLLFCKTRKKLTRAFFLRFVVVFFSVGVPPPPPTTASAGHGNMYEESYTAVFGRNALKLFSAVGLDLHSRNYAMVNNTTPMKMMMMMRRWMMVVIAAHFLSFLAFPANSPFLLYLAVLNFHCREVCVFGSPCWCTILF